MKQSSSTLFVGLDVHKDSISGRLCPGRSGVRRCSLRAPSAPASATSTSWCGRLQAKAARLVFAYEAGPCGYVLYRYLTGKGLDCRVVAPSLIPKKPGDRVKTDRRDAVELARLLALRRSHRRLRPVPSRTKRSATLSRAREDALKDLKAAKLRLKSFLLRLGFNYVGQGRLERAPTVATSAKVVCPTPAQQIVFQE